jgi:hypothetical protein
MLRTLIKKNVKIKGLFELISDGRDPMAGSWTFKKNTFSNDVITFFGDRSGKNPVGILPYKRGENSSTLMGGGEVISGEFTGCIMGVYKQGGSISVNHVDTEVDGHGNIPQKEQWEKTKGQSGFELLSEHSTKGEIPSYCKGLSDKKMGKYGTGMLVLCIASPTSKYDITSVMVFRDKNHDYNVLNVKR